MLNVTKTFLPPLEEYVARLEEVWANGWLTNRGELVRRLEQELSVQLRVRNLFAVANGTVAIQIAIKALKLSGEVITTPFSYVATSSSIVWEGCEPVFVDIEPEFLTIDQNLIEEAITDRTTGILATHVYGNPCDVEAIERIATSFGLSVIYDAAHCFGVEYKGNSILQYGDISTLSFHATKLFHTAEGGAIICKNDELFEEAMSLHNFGHDGHEAFFGLGINGKMSELNAGLGLAIAPFVNDIIERRAMVCRAYDELLEQTSVDLLRLRPNTKWNYSYYPVVFKSESELEAVKSAMSLKGIYPRRYFYPSLNNLPYVTPVSMPVAESISRRILCLPLSAETTMDEVELVSKVIRDHV